MTAWVVACRTDDLGPERVVRFDEGERTFAIYCSPEGDYFATDGLCTHGKAHLADGLVIDGTVECPKHNGIFDYRTGEAMAPPVCIDLARYPIRVTGDMVEIEI